MPVLTLLNRLAFNAVPGEDDGGDDDGDVIEFTNHNGPKINLIDTTVTPNVTYSVPAFMKGFERDTAWSTGPNPPNGVRFRCPKSKRQFRVGEFNPNSIEAYCGLSGTALFAVNQIGYGLPLAEDAAPGELTREQGLTNTFERICGGGKDPLLNPTHA